jgi:hypothetical protein
MISKGRTGDACAIARHWTVRTDAGQVHVEPGEAADPDAALRTDPKTLNGLLDDPRRLKAAIADGTAGVKGSRRALRRLLA